MVGISNSSQYSAVALRNAGDEVFAHLARMVFASLRAFEQCAAFWWRCLRSLGPDPWENYVSGQARDLLRRRFHRYRIDSIHQMN